MGDSGKLVCRLCLEVTPPCENEPIEETKKEILKVLLINMDFEISDYAVACNRCLELLQDCFEFKSYVVNKFMDVDLKVDIKKEIFQSQAHSQEGSRVCRLCMSLIGDETLNHTVVWKDGVFLKDMLKCCFPKMDLNAAHEPVICKQCLSNTCKYYEFMKSCQDVEQKIEHFRQVADRGSAGNKVILDDMLKFKDCDVFGKQKIIKNECTDAEFVDMNVIKCLKYEETENICEEIDIKDELDEVETNDPNQTEDGLSVTEETVRKTATKGKKHFCPKCDYSAKQNSVMKKHILSHSDNEMHRCIICNFATDTSLSMKAHMVIHRGPTKRYGCPECTYETDYKYTLGQHRLKHNDNSEVKMYKCPSCPLKTKYKRSLINHQKTHEDPKVVNKFQCGKCPFKTKWKNKLDRHVITHSIDHLYSCDQCTYSSKVKYNLVRHQLNHHTNREKRTYKCKLCTYQARANSTLKGHMIKAHADPSELPYLKCAHCSYETANRTYLLVHIKRQHVIEKQPKIKCELCPYVTSKRRYMWQHSFVHREATIHCHQCDFRAKRNHILQNHIKRYHTGVRSSSKRGQGESEPASVEAYGTGGDYDVPLSNMQPLLEKEEEGE